jgi:hypothetical protein
MKAPISRMAISAAHVSFSARDSCPAIRRSYQTKRRLESRDAAAATASSAATISKAHWTNDPVRG